MQTFLPFADFKKSFRVLDYKRLGKQRAEALILIHVIEAMQNGNNVRKGWKNHPITIMWMHFLDALKLYCNLSIEEWVTRGYNNTIPKFILDESDVILPDWLGYGAFHASHRSNLLRKDFEYYRQFQWKENPSNPYLWRDIDKKWYYFDYETKKRIYIN